jgi:hypothetical protein
MSREGLKVKVQGKTSVHILGGCILIKMQIFLYGRQKGKKLNMSMFLTHFVLLSVERHFQSILISSAKNYSSQTCKMVAKKSQIIKLFALR